MLSIDRCSVYGSVSAFSRWNLSSQIIFQWFDLHQSIVNVSHKTLGVMCNKLTLPSTAQKWLLSKEA